jgi:uridine phosphorylase
MHGKMATAKDHLSLKIERIPETVLLSGDPGRIDQIASFWDRSEVVGDNREFRTLVGTYKGLPMAACSTGIGGPSTEIAVIELFRHGARNLIRVGTSGGLAESIRPGDLIVNSACIRETGAADAFVPRSFPAVAHHELTLALIQACCAGGYRHHMGLGVTLDSFYATKPHLVRESGFPSQLSPQLAAWREAGALHIEMEAATIFVLASLLGLRAGCICTAGSNLTRGERPEMPPSNAPAIETACQAALILSGWDRLASARGCVFHPGLLTKQN